MQIQIKENFTHVLSDVIGTRFMIPYSTPYISKFFEKCKEYWSETGYKVTVDLKHCKFNPTNYTKITDFCDYINFIDSDNPVIDSMLDHNSRVSRVRKLEKEGHIQMEAIPATFDVVSMLNYIENLDRGKVYRLRSYNELNGQTEDVSILIAMCINYLYPRISVDLSLQAANYFRVFNRFWMHTIVKRDAYNLFWHGNILKVNVVEIDERGNNIFYIPGVGEVTEEVLNQNFLVMPFDFGSKSPKELNKDPELKDIFDDISNELQKLLKRKKKRKLTSELVTIERG